MKRRCLAIAVMSLLLGAWANADDTSSLSKSASPSEVSAQVDAIFEATWRDAGVQPAPPADDATFLRRATLDLTGIIPEVGEARAFMADESRDKRSKLIDELLDRPRHATHLANIWLKVLLPRTVAESTSAGFENWLQTRFRDNVSYQTLVQEILLARGSLTQSPPVIYYAALDVQPSELAASSSQVFLGVQIRCAECHDHPFTSWRQEDFWGLAAFFARVRGPSTNGGPAQLDDGPSGDVQHPETKKIVEPRLLDGTPVSTATSEPRRAILARWITDDENPYFARAAVNRVWWIMFGRGVVEPVDDFGDHNRPLHPEVLELLTDDFVKHGYDLRRLFRIIAGTRVYQLSSTPSSHDEDSLTTYTSMPVRSLSAEEVYNCLVQAAGRRDPLDANAPAVVEQRSAFLAQVDAPTRKATEFQGGIPQTLVLMNGPFVEELTGPLTGDLIAALVDSPFMSDEECVETLYLATLTRAPEADERQQSLEWVLSCAEAGDKAQAFSDILWSLLNSSEFILKR